MCSFLISVIIPVYNEEKLIYRSVYIINNILKREKISHEFILIDDGSSDNTWQVLNQLTKEIPQIKAIRLSRNFGKEAALCAGLETAAGDACISMDADLQHPPEIMIEMISLWHDKGYEIIEGVKISRGRENIISKMFALLFYRLLKALSGYNLYNATDYKLMDRKVVNAWKFMGESNTFFRGMSAWLGFKRISLPFAVNDMYKRKSKWSILKLFKLAMSALTSFSSISLHIITAVGIIFLIVAVPTTLEALITKIKGEAVDGITTIIALLLVIGSSIMISLGIIGTYIARIFDEVKRRPRYIINKKIESSKVTEKINKIFIDA